MATHRKRPVRTYVEPWGPLCGGCSGRLEFVTNNGVLVEICRTCGARAHPIRHPQPIDGEPPLFDPWGDLGLEDDDAA